MLFTFFSLGCLIELKFCEVSRNSFSNRCWKFQLSILRNKKVLFLKINFVAVVNIKTKIIFLLTQFSRRFCCILFLQVRKILSLVRKKEFCPMKSKYFWVRIQNLQNYDSTKFTYFLSFILTSYIKFNIKFKVSSRKISIKTAIQIQ